MASKDRRPKIRLGKSNPRRARLVAWAIGLSVCGGGLYAAFRYSTITEVEVATAPVRRGDFVISVRTRGEIRSTRSSILKAPVAPNLRIVKLASQGSFVHRGDVVVQFDSVAQEQNVIQQTLQVQSIQGSIDQLHATQRINDDADAMNKMTAEYGVESSKLDASKADVIDAIDGEKYRIAVGVQEGSLQQVKANINAHLVGNDADSFRLNQQKDKAVRDLHTADSYLGMMQLRAPTDGVVNLMANFRAGGTFGQSPPPFREGDSVWNGAEIAEIPDLSELYVDLKLDETERGKLQIGQQVRVRVDAIPDKEFIATLDFISPIAVLVFRGGPTSQKTFPARGTLKNLDKRLSPGMSASAEIIIERDPRKLLIPIRASFDKDGKPAAYLQTGSTFKLVPIEVGRRNDDEIVVTKGLKEGDIVTLESPAEAAKRARKKL
ncbi:MAG TPA: efflux RND transporter periplasmic adaptor subunit [Bryobacteraceae bacterium]|nr:efflux RND transporter periplasmic adaptor subunit [Bryobacteraceae bacterium]